MRSDLNSPAVTTNPVAMATRLMSTCTKVKIVIPNIMSGVPAIDMVHTSACSSVWGAMDGTSQDRAAGVLRPDRARRAGRLRDLQLVQPVRPGVAGMAHAHQRRPRPGR